MPWLNASSRPRLRPVSIPLTRQFDVDVDSTLETGARIIYLCSPNNPTGGGLSRKAVEQIVDQAPGLVIIDQAYAEFGGDDFTDLALRGRPVLVTRTMSKAFGLAGLRVGYCIGSPELIAEVLKAADTEQPLPKFPLAETIRATVKRSSRRGSGTRLNLCSIKRRSMPSQVARSATRAIL